MAKTIVFCATEEHAERMRIALSNLNADMVKENPDYVVRITGGDEYGIGGRKMNQAFQQYGYIVIFREHSDSSVSHKKGNVDTDIVFTIMKKIAEKEDLLKKQTNKKAGSP